jgi:protein phosphatase 1G
MGCDGIWECLTNQELVDKVKDYKKQGKTSSQIVEQLLDDLVAPDTSNGVGCDNMTTLLINF